MSGFDIKQWEWACEECEFKFYTLMDSGEAEDYIDCLRCPWCGHLAVTFMGRIL